MTDSTDAGTRESFEAAVRSFTEAEVALGEFVVAAQRFRSAAEAIERAQASLELTREPVLESVQVMRELAADLARIAASMSSAASTLSRLDPERFWSTFDQLVKTTDRNSAQQSADLGALGVALSRVRILQVATLLVGLAVFVAVLALLFELV